MVPLSSLFELTHGNKMDRNKMRRCSAGGRAVAFVGRSGERNGLSAFVEEKDGVVPHESGLITVALGGAALASFVQPKRFYTAQNVDVLRPWVTMSLDTKLFYCLCIQANRFRYSTYGREANRTLSTLLVPARHEVPSWVEGASELAIGRFCQELTDMATSC